MTPRQKQLIRETFAAVEPISLVAAELFYNRLFEIAPQYRSLFKGDIVEQGKKLMQMIGVAVANVDRLSAVVPAVEALGRRHVGYGVQPADYATVGEALIWTLEQGLGDAFTAEVRTAWIELYTIISDTMQAAAYESMAAGG